MTDNEICEVVTRINSKQAEVTLMLFEVLAFTLASQKSLDLNSLVQQLESVRPGYSDDQMIDAILGRVIADLTGEPGGAGNRPKWFSGVIDGGKD